MKKIICVFSLLFSVICFSQSITVNTSTYSIPQLVNTVLINSPCDITSNIHAVTGTNFGSTNGIGYFENTNPNFPMQSGVILSTGNVLNAPGPNTSMLSDGSPTWPGDSQLESMLAQSGVNMNSVNATILEFDFTPISQNFNFDFIFASEEYGNFQCGFSDSFAFILTNLNTGVSTNLAVVPNTNNPISVGTIRDFLYNSGCNSQNPQYFGQFNGGSNAAGSATNFNGQTVVMNASAVLQPNVPYRIKLVIADGTDEQSDSAIFLSSNSFNIGQDVLGDDLTIAANTAPCSGENYLIQSGLSPSLYTFSWKKNGQTLSGENGPNLNVNSPGTYELTYTKIANTCQTFSDSILIEYLLVFTTPNPIDLYVCDTGASSYFYNLSLNTSVVTQGLPAGTTVAYYSSQQNADNAVSPLPSNYNSAPNETIFVRINKANSNCYTVNSFDLLVADPPVANHPNDVLLCEDELNSAQTNYSLNNLNTEILGIQSTSLYEVKYYLTQNDALAGTNPINAPSFIATTTTIYAVVQLKTNSSCKDITSVNIIVNPLPLVDELQEVIVCTDYPLETLTNGNYFTGPNGTGTPLFAGDLITETQTIYIYNVSTTPPFCYSESSFRIVIIKPEDYELSNETHCNNFYLPVLDYGSYYTQSGGQGDPIPGGTIIQSTQSVCFYIYISPTCFVDECYQVNITHPQQVPQLDNVFDCTGYTLQPLTFGNYFDAPNGGGTAYFAGDVITSSKTMYVYGLTNGCPDESNFEIVIGLNFPTDVTECVSYTLPDLVVGGYFTQPMGQGTQIPAGTVIETTQDIYVYAVSQNLPNCTDNYHFTVTIELPVIVLPTITPECYFITLPPIAVGDYYTDLPINGGVLLPVGTQITESKTIIIYIENDNGCTNSKNLNITVYPAPVIDSRADIFDYCNSYTLTPLSNGNYYTETNGGGTMLNAGDAITTSQTIYIYSITANGCFTQNSFQIEIVPFIAQDIPDVAACDSYTLPALETENYYFTETGGPNASPTQTQLFPGDVITTSQTVYVYTYSLARGADICHDENPFSVTIVPHPIANPISNAIATFCDEDGNNDGVINLDLSIFNPTVLGLQNGPEFSVTYYKNLDDAENNVNQITNTELTTVYVKVTNTIAPSCPAIAPINIVVNVLPEPTPKDGIICIDNQTGAVLSSYIIESNLSNSNYTFQWFDEAGTVVGTLNNYEAIIPGIYSLIATNTSTGCNSEEVFVNVNTSQLAIVGYTVSEDFSNNQTVTVIATGNGGDYEYQLDNGFFQDSPVFEVISSGIHTITVRDKNGCGVVTVEALVVNYPKYFTPNGDGFHETWNITDLQEQLQANIYIFDRYGKLLKQIKPSGNGWDGKYNGTEMLSDDYWFTVSYLKNNETKEFRAHFTLKR
jgi:gliding motility-associated-like protein